MTFTSKNRSVLSELSPLDIRPKISKDSLGMGQIWWPQYSFLMIPICKIDIPISQVVLSIIMGVPLYRWMVKKISEQIPSRGKMWKKWMMTGASPMTKRKPQGSQRPQRPQRPQSFPPLWASPERWPRPPPCYSAAPRCAAACSAWSPGTGDTMGCPRDMGLSMGIPSWMVYWETIPSR